MSREASARSLRTPETRDNTVSSFRDAPPPSYESVVQASSPRVKAGSPRSSKVVSPRAHLRKNSTSAYQQFEDDSFDRAGSGEPRQKVPAHIKVTFISRGTWLSCEIDISFNTSDNVEGSADCFSYGWQDLRFKITIMWLTLGSWTSKKEGSRRVGKHSTCYIIFLTSSGF